MSDGQSIDLGGGGGSASFQFPDGQGTTGRSRIIEFREEQQTHFSDGPPGSGIKQGDLKFFPDGKPMTKIVVDLQTPYRNSEGLKAALPPGTDDGRRAVHLQAHKSPDNTSSMQAVTKAAVAAGCLGSRGKGAIRIGDDMELIGLGEVKTSSGQLAKKHGANYWMNTPSLDLAPAAQAAPTAAVPAPPVAVAVPAPPVAVPAPPVASGALDPMMPHITDPAQRTALNLPPLAAAVPPPPAAVPAPPVVVPPPPPAVKTTPEGLTLEQLVGGGWTREQAIAAYPALA